MKKVLIAWYWEYNNYWVNPSDTVAKEFDWRNIEWTIVKWIWLNWVYNSFKLIKPIIDTFEPDSIIQIWLESSATWIKVESTAYNMMRHEYKDNNWVIMNGEKISVQWPDSILLQHEHEEICSQLQNILRDPIINSHSWWRYICNDLMYRTALYLIESNLSTKHYFIHTPRTDYCVDKVTTPIPKEKFIMDHWELQKCIIHLITHQTQ